MRKHIINTLVFGLLVTIIALCGYAESEVRREIKRSLSIKQVYIDSVKQQWRAQARRTLAALRDTLNQEADLQLVNPYDDKELELWASVHLAEIRNGGETSDGFMIDAKTGKFLWDGSPDCAKESDCNNSRFIIEEAHLHRNVTLAAFTIDKMMQNFSTQANDNMYWEYDDSQELLEWVIAPRDRVGFGEQPNTVGGVTNTACKGVLIALGTQTDEILAPYIPVVKQYNEQLASQYRTLHLIDMIMLLSLLNAILTMTLVVYYSRKCGGAGCVANKNKT